MPSDQTLKHAILDELDSVPNATAAKARYGDFRSGVFPSQINQSNKPEWWGAASKFDKADFAWPMKQFLIRKFGKENIIT